MKPATVPLTAALVGWLASPGLARAADTIETWDHGAADFEVYAGADGMGRGAGEVTIGGESVLGYGIVERLSGYLRGAASTSDELTEGNGEAAVGLFGTPIDTDHFDFDLVLDVGWTLGSVLITPALEVNLDLLPELALWGTYFRGAEALVTRKESVPQPAGTGASGAVPRVTRTVVAPSTELVLGTYLTVADGHQLLVEADTTVAHRPAVDEAIFDLGGVALGYNVCVHESIELISQLFLDVPIREGDRLATGVSLGLIGTAQILSVEENASGESIAKRRHGR